MTDLSLHLAPNAPWLLLALASLVLVALALWAYRFSIPPLPALARRALPALRGAALLALVWLLAQPVFERARAGGPARLVVLLDRSRSMDLP
ncbi:MAG TPA: VWA domain-containing protein, partial [Candidatus Eisenbacteria bacterium]|nr:VWA domain-containing protein [Candidatus Eisenbacteria bacterium]